MANYSGKLIVIDGTDGSGKATQTELLANKLRLSGFEVEIADFPQHGLKSAGLVEEYLNGKYGEADSVSPYIASTFYAADRFAASFKIKQWLMQGKIVISNRYVSANMGHQGGKIANSLERKHFFDWLFELEYEIYNIPKPDLSIILHVDAFTSQKLVDQKNYRNYIETGHRDQHENNLDHLRNAEQAYLDICKNFSGFTLIECVDDGRLKSKEEISWLVWQEAINLLEKTTQNILAPNFKELHEKQQERGEVKYIKLKVQRLTTTAKLPTKSFEHDAGVDLYTNDYYSILPGEKATLTTGLKIAIPVGYAGLIWDKHSIAQSSIHTLAGVIDADYQGEIFITLINLGSDIFNISPSQRIAQLLIQKVESPIIVEEKLNSSTERGDSNFDYNFSPSPYEGDG